MRPCATRRLPTSRFERLEPCHSAGTTSDVYLIAALAKGVTLVAGNYWWMLMVLPFTHWLCMDHIFPISVH